MKDNKTTALSQKKKKIWIYHKLSASLKEELT